MLDTHARALRDTNTRKQFSSFQTPMKRTVAADARLQVLTGNPGAAGQHGFRALGHGEPYQARFSGRVDDDDVTTPISAAFELMNKARVIGGGVGTDHDSEVLVTSILSMADLLDLDVVAEGIETEEQLAFLQHNACGYAQGYLLSRPMPSEAFPDWVRDHDTARQDAPTAPAAS